MDILKKVYSNPSTCKVDGSVVEVVGKTYPADMPVEFPTRKTASYSLGSVVFYLMNSGAPITEYVAMCQRAGIPKISYLDQEPIKADIEGYTASVVSGFFIKPVYTLEKEYHIPVLNELYYIIVPGDVSSVININSAVQMLAKGAGDAPRQGDAQCLEHGENRFVIYDDPSGFTAKDWRRVRAVFLDGSVRQQQGWEDRLPELVGCAAVFVWGGGSTKHTKLTIKNGEIANYEEMWEKINEFTAV